MVCQQQPLPLPVTRDSLYINLQNLKGFGNEGHVWVMFVSAVLLYFTKERSRKKKLAVSPNSVQLSFCGLVFYLYFFLIYSLNYLFCLVPASAYHLATAYLNKL